MLLPLAHPTRLIYIFHSEVSYSYHQNVHLCFGFSYKCRMAIEHSGINESSSYLTYLGFS
jgi:hypothetical protein